ncbi:MAG: hypothetical protein RI885_1111 [Actinomycetota bacterium]
MNESPSRVDADRLPVLGLLMLAAAIFVCVTSEFLPTGLLPQLAADLDVSTADVGLLVTVYAGTVVVSTAPMAKLTSRLPRKPLILLALAVFAITNVATAFAPSFAFVVVARVIAGVAHGLFWAVVGAYAAHLVAKPMLARAVAITSSGATAAFVLGVPVGTAIGTAFDWRVAFASIGVSIVVIGLLIARFLPPVEHLVTLATGEIPVPARKDPTLVPVLVLCAIIIAIMLGQNSFYTYIVPFLIDEAGFDPSATSGLLFLYGAAGAAGLLLVGIVGPRHPKASLIGSFVIVALSVLVIGLVPLATPVVLVSLVLWGIAFGGGPALLQTRMLQSASRALRDQASAWFTVSFNLAIGGGALLGSLVLRASDVGVLPFVESAIILVAVVVIVLTDRMLSRRAARPVRESAARPAA